MTHVDNAKRVEVKAKTESHCVHVIYILCYLCVKFQFRISARKQTTMAEVCGSFLQIL
jgi:hypothetical protein